MKAEHILYGLIALVVLFFGVMLPGPQTIMPAIGGAAGPDHYGHEYFNAGLSAGGVYTLSTTTNAILRDGDIEDAKVISISSSASPAISLTTPASSTWASLPDNGTAQSWIIDNLHTAAATTTTITAGTGVDLDGATTNDDVINGGVSGILTCWRLPSTNIRCIVEEMVDAG